MQNLISQADKDYLRKLFTQKRNDYYQALSCSGGTAQHYDMLRGRIAELEQLLDELKLNQ